MPKMKTHSGAKKRFKVTAKGSIKRRQKNKSHILTKMTSKRKMSLRGNELVDASDTNRVLRMLKLK